jgi:hypothetical protein
VRLRPYGHGAKAIDVLSGGRYQQMAMLDLRLQLVHFSGPGRNEALISCAGNRRRKVSQVAGDFGHDQELLSALESLGLEEEALRRDKITGDTSTIEDDAAQRRLYARAFEEWAAGNIDGTAQDVFHAVTSILAGDG